MTGSASRFFVLAGLFLAAFSTSAKGERRALLIGINNYEYKDFPSLKTAFNDARHLAEILDAVDFKITILGEADSEALRKGIDQFVASIQPGDTALVYYAGHGIESAGINYLIPADLPPDASRLESMGVRADILLKQLASRAPSLKVLILDACRNNALKTSSAIGLAPMRAKDYGTGTFIAYASDVGESAIDGGRGENGLFAHALALEMVRAGLDIGEVFRNVRKSVKERTGGHQTPVSFDIMVQNFYFNPPNQAKQNEKLDAISKQLSNMIAAVYPERNVSPQAVAVLQESDRIRNTCISFAADWSDALRFAQEDAMRRLTSAESPLASDDPFTAVNRQFARDYEKSLLSRVREWRARIVDRAPAAANAELSEAVRDPSMLESTVEGLRTLAARYREQAEPIDSTLWLEGQRILAACEDFKDRWTTARIKAEKIRVQESNKQPWVAKNPYLEAQDVVNGKRRAQYSSVLAPQLISWKAKITGELRDAPSTMDFSQMRDTVQLSRACGEVAALGNAYRLETLYARKAADRIEP